MQLHNSNDYTHVFKVQEFNKAIVNIFCSASGSQKSKMTA